MLDYAPARAGLPRRERPGRTRKERSMKTVFVVPFADILSTEAARI
jgi:hypothetical protein